uniref:Arabidopsis thaliana genomic DNA, chromosome 5, P1 clone:MOK16 n=1 Tax=Arabidopsis thaliana TaxID=3702 RepID=Q9FYN1_ARATH|nr:unnamed protein product [Arabidopsis thaliana]
MKSTVMMIFLIIYLLIAVPCFAKGSEQTDSEVYEIDYRGPETHNSRPPPETMHGKPPYIHHNTSAAGLGAHVGGKKRERDLFQGEDSEVEEEDYESCDIYMSN